MPKIVTIVNSDSFITITINSVSNTLYKPFTVSLDTIGNITVNDEGRIYFFGYSEVTTPVTANAEALRDLLSTYSVVPATTGGAIDTSGMEAKQQAGNALMTSLNNKDFATQTTLASILAKIIVSPATPSVIWRVNVFYNTSI